MLPRYQGDRFTLTNGFRPAQLEVVEIERELKPDFQTSFGLRKVVDFNMNQNEVSKVGKGGVWYDGSEQKFNESSSLFL